MPDPSYRPRWETWLDNIVFAIGRLELQRSGYGHARGLMRVFWLVERVLARLANLQQVRPDAVMRYQIATLHTDDLPLSDGRWVRRGQRVMVLHWNNGTIARSAASLPDTHAMTWYLIRTSIRDFRDAAALVQEGKIPADVQAVWAETIIYKALPRLGFSIRPAPRTLRTPFARLFQLTMVAIYGRDGLARLEGAHQRHLELGEAWMGMDEFLRRYGSRPEKGGAGQAKAKTGE